MMRVSVAVPAPRTAPAWWSIYSGCSDSSECLQWTRGALRCVSVETEWPHQAVFQGADDSTEVTLCGRLTGGPW